MLRCNRLYCGPSCKHGQQDSAAVPRLSFRSQQIWMGVSAKSLAKRAVHEENVLRKRKGKPEGRRTKTKEKRKKQNKTKS